MRAGPAGQAMGFDDGKWKPALAGALTAMAVVAALPLQAPLARDADPDEDAALILYREGRDAFKRGDDATAVRELQRAFALAPNDFIRYYLGLALERSGRCGEAMPHLLALAGRLPAEQERARVAAAARCEVRRAEVLANEGRCAEAAEVLAGVPGGVSPEADGGRTRIATECERRAAGFVPENASQRAALVLVLAGRRMLEEGNPAGAAERFEKAIALFDEPHIRLLAARARYADLRCPEALRHSQAAVSGLPDAREEVEAMRAWCETFAVGDDAPVDTRTRRSLMARYRDATSLRTGGFELLSATLATYDNPAVRLYLARRLYALGRFEEAASMARGAVGRLAGREAEVTDVLDRARFAAADANEGVPKDRVYDAWRKAEALLRDGDATGAIDTVRAWPLNPAVARVLAEAHARRGECEAAETHVTLAQSSEPPPGPTWARDVRSACLGYRQALLAEREQALRRERLLSRRAAFRARRGVSWGLIATGAACLVVAGVSGWQYAAAGADSDDAMAAYDAATTGPQAAAARARAEEARDRARAWSATGWATGAAGVAAMTAGVLLRVLTDRGEAALPVVATPAAPGGAAGLSLSGRF